MNTSRSRWTTGRAAGAALLALATITIVGFVMQAHARPSPLHYRPAASVARIKPETFLLPDAGRIVSFDVLDDRLVLLDGLNRRVIRMDRNTDGSWEPVVSFGSGGNGPGEFNAPTGIAISSSGAVTVADWHRLHHFDSEGVLLSTMVFDVGCAHFRPDVVSYDDGFLVTASCWQRDTLMMVLSYVNTAGESRRIAAEPRASLDGRVGSYLVGGSVVVDGTRYLFGTGLRACLYEGSSADAVRPRCDIARDLYGDRPSRATEEFLRQQRARSPMGARALQWPASFPVYKHMLITPGGDVLLREFAPDSVVIRYVGSEIDLFAAGLDGLVGCRQAGCLWSFPQIDGVRLFLLPAAALAGYGRGGPYHE
jgi:hypothetical protein